MNEAERLESLWAGEFGADYRARNADADHARGAQWAAVLERWPAERVLEVGCNIGGNLIHIAPHTEAWGIDINADAVRAAMATTQVTGVGVAPARSLPFRDRWFDLTFTAGVLIHQPTATLPRVMSELVRCSSRWVLAAEYASESGDEEEVPYHQQRGALFRRDYGRLYLEMFPELRLVESWFNDEGSWDRVTFWMFERTT